MPAIRQRAQSTLELALVLPVLIGLLGAALQGGLLISDQVNLEHFAYEGALWAAENSATSTPAMIQDHIYRQVCGGDAGPPSSNGTKFCAGSGAGQLAVSVTSRSTATAAAPVVDPTSAVLAACKSKTKTKRWHLTVSPDTGSATTTPTTTVQYTVTLVLDSGGSLPDPVVDLSAGNGFPRGKGWPVPGSTAPVFSPASLTPGNATSLLSWTTAANSRPGAYTFHVIGFESNSGNTHETEPATGIVVVGSPVGPIACANPPLPLPPSQNIVSVGSATSLTIPGADFQNGATVMIGSTLASLVTVVSATVITVPLPAGLPQGVYNITVTNPDGCTGTSSNSLTVVTGGDNDHHGIQGGCTGNCGGGTDGGGTQGGNGNAGNVPNTCVVAGSPGNAYQVVVTVTWTEQLFIPWISSTVALSATHVAYCE